MLYIRTKLGDLVFTYDPDAFTLPSEPFPYASGQS